MSYVSAVHDSTLPPLAIDSGDAMTVTPPPVSRNGNGHSSSRVTVVSPEGRELIWLSHDSVVTSWEVGQVVIFRNGRWRVLARQAREADALTVTLGPLEA
jgi:hypothetical protein